MSFRVIKFKQSFSRLSEVVQYCRDENNVKQPIKTRYTFDLLGRLTRTTDNAGNEIKMWYDAYDRKIRMNDPDMGEWKYAFDSAGNLTSQTDAKGQVQAFEYDQLDRLVRKSYLNSTQPDVLFR
jgi:YD repeat-containing protein